MLQQNRAMEKTMSKRNVMKNEMLVNKIDELGQKRKAWEEGAYRASTVELCLLLDECYAIYAEARADKGLAKRIGKLVEERNLIVQANTSLATRIVRLVFGECGKRTYTYAKVLTVAADEKRENETMLTFVNNRNGIENVRRNKAGVRDEAEQREEYAEYADEILTAGNAIADGIKATGDMEADEKATFRFAVALLKTDGKGNAKIVYATNAKGLVRAALINAGKKLKTKAESDKATLKLKANEKKRKEVMDKIAA